MTMMTGALLPAQTPDLIVANARIWTGNPKTPWAEALAVAGERLVAVGGNLEIRKLAGPRTRRIDARGRLLTPGFIDSHVHFIEGGFQLTSVPLRDVNSKRQFVERIRRFAATLKPGTWITGGDWDHTLWGGELPARQWIDAVTPANPVWIRRLDGHMGLANSLALKIARVTRGTAEVEGGEIVRDAAGDATGILKDNAGILVERCIPLPSLERRMAALDVAMTYVAARGVTSVHHMGGWDDLDVFARARRENKLRTRIYAAVPLSTWKKLAGRVKSEGRGDDWLRIGLLKGFVDGSLGSHTAAMLEPFSDAPDKRGLLVNRSEDLYDWTAGATAAGLQVAVHAIGDRANRLQLDIYERVLKTLAPGVDPRFRIEHAQHIAPSDIERFARLHVIASMQPYHLIDDGRWADAVIGAQRARTSYAYRSLLDSGARLALGSDWFVAPPTPLEGIYAAVTRRTLDNKNVPAGWVPEQKIGVEEALAGYTSGAAYASFEEDRKGTLEPGRLADFVILDADIFKIPPEEIGQVKVRMTVVGGKVVYRTQ
jgi:predicted amidohydrolase YtcJ